MAVTAWWMCRARRPAGVRPAVVSDMPSGGHGPCLTGLHGACVWTEHGVLELLEGFAQSCNNPWGLLILCASAALEYVFPPFPGDTVTLFGAILAGAHGWSPVWILTAVTAGSMLGAAADYWVGGRLHAWRGGKDGRADMAIARVLEGFRRWGVWWIALNRFLPGIRAFFFVAAGMCHLPFFAVMGLALLSALAWNVLILAVGLHVGSSFPRLRALAGDYQAAVWCVIGVGALAVFAVWVIRRRKPV